MFYTSIHNGNIIDWGLSRAGWNQYPATLNQEEGDKELKTKENETEKINEMKKKKIHASDNLKAMMVHHYEWFEQHWFLSIDMSHDIVIRHHDALWVVLQPNPVTWKEGNQKVTSKYSLKPRSRFTWGPLK